MTSTTSGKGRRYALVLVAGLLITIVLSLVALPASPAFAADASSAGTVVRVGYFSNGDYMHKDLDGNYRGFDIEYYDTIAGYAGWKLQFVDYPNLTAALQGLQAGDVDIMSGLSKTSEREATYIASAQKMSTSHIAVQTRADDDRYSAGDVTTMADLTCGILKGSNVVALYTAWCQENGLTPHIVEYDSIDARNAALAAKEVDAIAGGSTIEGAQKIAEFPALDLYFMLNANRTDLKSQLDNAMSIMSLSSPSYATDLYFRYFPVSKNTTPSFSAKEKAFVAARGTIKVAVLRDDEPFSKEDANGTISGIIPEYFAHLGEVMGAKVQCVAYDTKDEACAALVAGDVDVVGKFTYDVYDATSRGLIQCNPDLTLSMVEVSRAGTGDVSVVAVPECNYPAVAEYVKTNDIPLELHTYSNGETSFAALKDQKVDAVVCSQATATWLLNRNRSSSYTVSSFSGNQWDICCALAATPDGNTLRSMLDKMTAVDGGYINQLITADTLQDSEDATTLVDRIPVGWLVMAVVLALIMLAIAMVALIVIVRNRKAERAFAARQAEADHREAELRAQEKSNEERHAFFGTISHDMRTPLNGIVGFSDLALGADDPAKVRDYVSKIKTSGLILSGLVDDTLVLSRMESGKQTLSLIRYDVASLIEETCVPVRALADDKGVALCEDVEAVRGRMVMIDRTSLQKVFLNLLSNAVRFTPAGGTVTISAELGKASGGRRDTIVTVSDTGQGISKEFLPHVFEPFSQEDPVNGGMQGTGLGLTIVKGIVRQMGGSIDVVSEKGKGATFTVRLPLAEAAGDTGAEESSRAVTGDAARLAGMRFLVCEDNRLNIEIIRSVLEGRGAEVVCAENGLKGVEAFEASQPGFFSAVFMDLRMPELDGYGATRRIRATGRPDAHVPIIAISADANDDDKLRCLKEGMDAHVSKPIDQAELFGLIERLCKNPQSAE